MPTTEENIKWKAYWWPYDDGSFGFVLRDMQEKKKKSLIEARTFTNRTELDAELDKRRNECKVTGHKMTEKKLKIPSGLKYLGDTNKLKWKKKQGAYSWQELEKFLNSCGTVSDNSREVMRLFSGILSGYCARIITPVLQKKCPMPLQNRAPVIMVNYSDICFDFLTQAMQAMAVHTFQKKKLHAKCPKILPKDVEHRKVDEYAYLWLGMDQKKKYCFPAQYRDTAVLIYGRFFPTREIYSFVRRNRWASCVLFDTSGKEYNAPPIQLKASLLACKDFSWNAKAINYLIERFVLYLSKLDKETKQRLNKKLKDDIEQCVLRYYAQKGIRRYTPSENYFLRMQMLSLDLFLEFCQKNKVIDEEQKEWFQAMWYNLLLPKCCQMPQKPKSMQTEEELLDPEEDAIRAFEGALLKMLAEEYREHFLFVSQGEFYDRENLDNPAIQYWGYLRNYSPNKNGKKVFPALVFRRDDFKRFSADFLNKGKDTDYLLNTLRKKSVPYYFKTEKMRFPMEKNDKEHNEYALILNIDEMDFLPDEVKKSLLDMMKQGEQQSTEQ